MQGFETGCILNETEKEREKNSQTWWWKSECEWKRHAYIPVESNSDVQLCYLLWICTQLILMDIKSSEQVFNGWILLLLSSLVLVLSPSHHFGWNMPHMKARKPT